MLGRPTIWWRVREDLGGGRVELRGVDRAHERELVGHGAQVGPKLGDLGSGLAALQELVGGAQQLGLALDEGEALAFHELVGDRLAVGFAELGLVVEEVHLGRRSRHEEIDDALRLRREVRALRGRREEPLVEQAHEGHAPDPEARLAEEVPPGDRPQQVACIVHVFTPCSGFRRGSDYVRHHRRPPHGGLPPVVSGGRAAVIELHAAMAAAAVGRRRTAACSW
jgi:hypothetical protein